MPTKQTLLDMPLFTKEMPFAKLPAALRQVMEAADSAGCSGEEYQALAQAVLSRVAKLFDEQILLHSYHGYVSFSRKEDFTGFVYAVADLTTLLEQMLQWPVDPLPVKKDIIYYRVIAMNASSKNFRHTMSDEAKKRWEEDIFRYEEEILAQDKEYVVPTSELLTNQRLRLTRYWIEHNKAYWEGRAKLDKARAALSSYRHTIQMMGLLMLIIPLVFAILMLLIADVFAYLSAIVLALFVLIGILVYLFSFLYKANEEKIKEFEYQGIGQLDEEIPLPEEQEPTPS